VAWQLESKRAEKRTGEMQKVKDCSLLFPTAE